MKKIPRTNCVHYCAVGGHLWNHLPPSTGKGKKAIPKCPFRTTSDPDSTIKFFRICPVHFKKRRRYYENEDDFF